jgi:phage terminase large subunit-like protein
MFRHGGNPVARWMADNLRPTVDSNGNVKPDKAKSTNKIDGISAATTAMFVAMNVEAEATSAYEDHGVESI